MKILHVIANVSPVSGGPAAAAEGMARAMARRGHRVALATTNWHDGGAFEVPLAVPVMRDGVDYRYFPIQRPRFFGTSLPMARALPDLVAAADVVHIHSLYMFHDWAAGRACRARGVPYLLRPHGSLDPYIYRRRRWRKAPIELLFQNRVTDGAAALHFTTEEERRLAAPYGRGMPGVVVPLGLDLAEFEDLPAKGRFRTAHPEIGERPVVLFFGRLHAKKGLDLLIPAVARAVAAGHDPHLVLAGPDGGMAAAARRLARKAGIAERTTFTGMLTGPDRLAVLQDADLFVLPSRSENFGLAVIEAMACGVPVLISDRVNIWREVEADGAAAVVPPAVEPLAAALASLLADPGRRARMGTAGRESVRRRYDWDTVTVTLERAYEGVIEGHPRLPD